MARIAAKERLDRKMGRDVNEARGRQYRKGRGVQSGIDQTKIEGKPKTRARTGEIVDRKLGALKDAQKRVSEVPHHDPWELEADIYYAANKLRASRKKKQRMKADLEKGWGGTNEDRGDALLKGLGFQSAMEMGSRVVGSKSVEGQIRQVGKRPWKGARAVKAHTRTRRASEKKLSTIKKLYRLGATRALPGSSVEPHVQQAAGALRDALNKRRKMRSDLEGGSQHFPQAHD